jgi:VWFA-related protein
MRGFGIRLLCASCALIAIAALCPAAAAAQEQGDRGDQPVFRSSVDLVSVTAVVRDKRGRVMRSLTRDDFELIDGGERRPLLDFDWDANAPASVTFLVDGSGSMAAGVEAASRVSELVLAQLNPLRDEAALLTFDTRLLTLREFTSDFDDVRCAFNELDAFGATSIYDAIAGTAGMVGERTGKRRAIVVITDGTDNASTYTADQVAWIASTIDVPVYVFAVGDAVPPTPDETRSTKPQTTPLIDLARATGGEFFYAGNSIDQAIAAGRVIDELRHQYLIAFEPSSVAGLHRLEIRTRNSELKVRSRQWYGAGSTD